MKNPMIQYKPQQHDPYFAGFVLTKDEYSSHYHSWKDANLDGLESAFEQGERLLRIMVETGYYKVNEPE